MKLELPQPRLVGKKKTRQLQRIRKLLIKAQRPYAFNEQKLAAKSRTQLTEIINDLREEAKKL